MFCNKSRPKIQPLGVKRYYLLRQETTYIRFNPEDENGFED